jgi:hypothetical protein
LVGALPPRVESRIVSSNGCAQGRRAVDYRAVRRAGSRAEFHSSHQPGMPEEFFQSKSKINIEERMKS